jgi:hypothetical protein
MATQDILVFPRPQCRNIAFQASGEAKGGKYPAIR